MKDTDSREVRLGLHCVNSDITRFRGCGESPQYRAALQQHDGVVKVRNGPKTTYLPSGDLILAVRESIPPACHTFAHVARRFRSLIPGFAIFFEPVQSGYFTHPRNFPNFPLRSTNHPSLHSGQAENDAPQLQSKVPGLSLLATGRSLLHALQGSNVSPHRLRCSHAK